MPENIFLINVHSDYNAGDLALSRVTVQQLEQNFQDCKITISMNDPQSYEGDLPVLNSHFVWVLDGYHWNWGRLIWLAPGSIIPIISNRIFGKAWFGLTPKKIRDWVNAYIEADLVVSTAGGFLRSSGRGLTLLLTVYSLILAVLAGKPLYIFPQSIGPFSFTWEGPLVKWIYSKARLIMAREYITVDHLTSCGIPRDRIILLPDVAFGFKGASKDQAREWLLSKNIDRVDNKPIMAMTVMDWSATNQAFGRQSVYEDAVSAVIKFFVTKNGGKVLLVPQVWGPSKAEDDRITARRIAERLSEMKSEVVFFDEPISPDMLQAIFGEMDIVIGTRMHSNIFAATRMVPVIPIGYLQKTLGIANSAGLDEWVVDIEEVDAEILINKLTELWEQKELVKSHLAGIIPHLIEESKNAGILTAQDYFGEFITVAQHAPKD